jgi:hypothetical protein
MGAVVSSVAASAPVDTAPQNRIAAIILFPGRM